MLFDLKYVSAAESDQYIFADASCPRCRWWRVVSCHSISFNVIYKQFFRFRAETLLVSDVLHQLLIECILQVVNSVI